MSARRWILTLGALGLASAAIAAPSREVRIRAVDVRATLPSDLVEPEGKSRWHLEDLKLGEPTLVDLSELDGRITVDRVAGATASHATFEGADRDRWLLPDRDPSQMKMGSHVVLNFTETRDGLTDALLVDVSTVGIGWLHLPSGPREAVLQRVLVMRRKSGEIGFHPDSFIHRWVDPRAGVVAEVSGPASPTGASRLFIESASAVEEVLLGAADLKIYADQLERGPYVDLKYGWDKGPGTTVASLVSNPGISNICDLVNLPSWDFSADTTGAQETVSTTAPINASETCNAARCGYSVPGAILGRIDRNVSGSPLRKDNQSIERENRPSDVTIWLRAGTQAEDKSGAFGTGESRFCHANEGATTRQPVPFWRFSHPDGAKYYLQAGDSWESIPLNQPGSPPPDCQETFYSLKCGATQILTPNPLWAHACTSSGQTHLGKQSVQMVKSGVVTLPSGHTLNAIVTRNTADYCVYSAASCSAVLDRVRTVVYYWQVPYLGSVVLLRSPKTVNYTAAEMTAGATTPCTNLTTLDYTDFSYGLFPPTTITAGTSTDTTVDLSWTPGNVSGRITGYKVYWDTDSGSSSPYAFNTSIVGPGTTSTTISGLTPATTYYFTVTSLSTYTDPQSGVVANYESIVYPTTVSGDPNFAYPVEVQKQTTCVSAGVPTQAVQLYTAADRVGANPAQIAHLCWTPSTDTCAVGYDVLGSDDKTSPAAYSVRAQVGLTNCWDGDPAKTFLLIRTRGIRGNGPWGHYGQ